MTSASVESRRPLRLEYLPAAQLTEHPSNWRLHPPDQLAALGELMDEVGWAGALLFNERTGRLLDGHARRALFAKRGGEVPVLIGDWDEAAERKIVALLDAVGEAAGADPMKLKELLDSAGPISPALAAMAAPRQTTELKVRYAPVVSLEPHPRNYRTHTTEQVEQLIRSIEDHGVFRPIVVALPHEGRYPILAGHGLRMAAERMGRPMVPIVCLDVDRDDPLALKVLAADNEIAKGALTDFRKLTEVLLEVQQASDLRGTGYDPQQLAALLMTHRTEEEIPDANVAAEWAGAEMPEHWSAPLAAAKLVVLFRTLEDRDRFAALIGSGRPAKSWGKVRSIWWPDAVERVRQTAVKFDVPGEGSGA